MMVGKWRNHLLLQVSLLTVTSIGFAERQLDTKEEPSFLSSGVLAFSLGPVFESAGEAQTFYLAPNIEKTYTANQLSQTLANGEVFLGMQRPWSEKLKTHIGLAISTTSAADLSGNIWDDADVEFNNYAYSYKVRHTQVALKGKLLIDNGYVVIPWVSGSLGVGINQAYSYSNTPTISEAVMMPNFESNSTTAFTYTFGVGMARNLTPNWQVGLGYEFSDWGGSQLGRAFQQTLNTGLTLSHLYTNGILFNLTYLV